MADTHYVKIAENIDHGPLTAPKVDGGFSPAFIDYLKLIFTAEQAAVIQHVEMPPGKIKTGIELAEASGRSTDEVGDLLATVMAEGSRNRRAGELLGQGMAPDQIPNEIGQASEALDSVPQIAATVAAAGCHADALQGLADLATGKISSDEWVAALRRVGHSRRAA